MKFNSTIIPKLINNIMYDGKRGVAAKIVYDAIEKIKFSVSLLFLLFRENQCLIGPLTFKTLKRDFNRTFTRIITDSYVIK